jgi:hypothetical protein
MINEGWRDKWKLNTPERNRKGEYIGSIVWNLIMLFVVNKLPDWHAPFISHNYQVVLYLLNICILVQIAGNILMLVLNFREVRYISKIIMEAATFLVLILFYYVYPFDFSTLQGWEWLDRVLPIFFIIGMIFSVLKIVSSIWNLFARSRNNPKP